jgi:hypothetical protein
MAFDPATYNLTIQAGEDFRLVLTLKDATGTVQNLSGYSYKSQYRSAAAPSGTIYATYSCSVLSPTAGTVSVRLSKAQTTALTGTQGVWDLLQTDSGGADSYLLKGKALVQPTVTR